MRRQAFKRAALAMCVLVSSALSAHARDHIHIVGSSTVFPFVTTVAEEFGQKTRFSTPIVEQLGTGGGLKLFCSGLGATAPFDYPDIANASRPIKARERDLCARNGVTALLELQIGYDGIVLANALSGPEIAVTKRQLYLALAKKVPAPGMQSASLIENPYEKWSQIAPDLPDIAIKVLGPPETSGTRDAFNLLAIKSGCETYPQMQQLKQDDPKAFEKACTQLRDDQRFIEAGENDNLVVQKLRADPDMLGILPFSFVAQNADVVKPAKVNGFLPSPLTIRSGDYAIARSLYVYVKPAHARSVPGIEVFLRELFSDEAMGDYGYLVDKGLIPLSDRERYSAIPKLTNMSSKTSNKN